LTQATLPEIPAFASAAVQLCIAAVSFCIRPRRICFTSPPFCLPAYVTSQTPA
jgi:hypothetical protein